MLESATKLVHYETFGPFPLDLSSRRDPKSALADFWAARANDSKDGLCDAVGVYVWTGLIGGKRLPWNVGLTNRQGFKGRFEQKSPTFLRLQLAEAVHEVQVFLLALKKRSDSGFRSPTVSTKIASNIWLEKELIRAAMVLNPHLNNRRDTGKQRAIVVDGYLNDGDKRGASAKAFAKLFSIKS